MIDNSGKHEYVGDDHAVIPKDRKHKGAFLPHVANWQLRKVTGMALNEVPDGIGQKLEKMSSEGETQYALMKHYYKLMGINYEFPVVYKNQVSEKEKKEILAFREQGLTFEEVGQKVKRDEKTVREVISDLRKTIEIKNDRKRLSLSEDEKRRIFTLRQEGLSCKKIAERIVRSEATVTNAVKVFEKEGVIFPTSEYKKPLTEEQKKQILDLYNHQGLGYKEITEKLGVSKASISRVVNSSLSFFKFSFW